MNDLQGDFSKSNQNILKIPASCSTAQRSASQPKRSPRTKQALPDDHRPCLPTTHTQTKPSTTPRWSRWGWCLIGRKEKQQQQKKTRDKKDVGKICKKSMKQEQREQKSRVQTAREEKFGEKINSSSAKMVIFFPPQSVTTLVFNYFCVYVFFSF